MNLSSSRRSSSRRQSASVVAESEQRTPTDYSPDSSQRFQTIDEFKSLLYNHQTKDSKEQHDDTFQRQQHLYKQARDKVEGHQLIQINASHKRQEDELYRFHDDGHCATPVTDEVGVVLGKISELALSEGLPQLSGLVEELVEALNEQMTSFYKWMREGEPLFEMAPKVKPFAADEELAKLQREKAEGDVKQAKAVQKKSSRGGADEDGAAATTMSSCQDILSSTTCLMAEALATTLHAEEVRMYLMDDDGNGLKYAASYPPRPPLKPNEKPPELPRALQSSVYVKGMAVAGHDAKQFVLPSVGEANVNGETTFADAPRTCLVWPVPCTSGGNAKSLGVIEARNKDAYEDEEQRRFSEEDELIMHCAARLFGAMVNRYNVHHFAKNVEHSFAAMARPLGVVPPHLPEKLKVDVAGAEKIANWCLRRQEPLVVYRGPTSSIHRPIGVGKKSDIFSAASSASSDLNSVEYALDSLHDMWKTAYEENVIMHSQCRHWGTQVKELSAITRTFQDALVAARGISDLDDLHLYLRSMELSLKSGSSKTVSALVEKTAAAQQKAELSASQSSTQSPVKKKENMIASMYVDGPQNVRTYTVDPETKREQLQAIADMVTQADEDTKLRDEHLVIKHLSKTESSSAKVKPKYSRPPLTGITPKRKAPTAGVQRDEKPVSTAFRLRPTPPPSASKRNNK